MRVWINPQQKVPKSGLEGVNCMNVNSPPRVDYESRAKHKKIPSVTCAKRTKWRVYTMAYFLALQVIRLVPKKR